MNEVSFQPDLFLDRLNKLWPVLAFIAAIIWKQIITHFDLRNIKEHQLKLEGKCEILENEFDMALKDHIIENKISNEKLTEAITELIKATTILTVKIESLEKYTKP